MFSINSIGLLGAIFPERIFVIELASTKIECDNGLVGSVSGSLFTIDNVSKSGTCTLTFNPIEN